MKPMNRRGLLLGTGVAIGAAGISRIGSEKIPFGLPFPPVDAAPGSALLLNDASELSPVKLAKHFIITEKPGDALLARLRQHLADARQNNMPAVAHAARHSMGGQSLTENGLALTFDQDWIEPDAKNQTYRVAAGTRWRTVIKTLDPINASPKVMQSNNDFGVASTFSVNAHGWPVTFSGGGTTARSIRLLLANGEHVTCSRQENSDLFSAALGGYGLFGIITELEMEMVPNSRLVPAYTRMPATDFGLAFEKAVHDDKTVQMAYGRMNVSIDGFFDEALLVTYRPASDQSNLPPSTGSGMISKISRDIFRQQLGSDRWKKLRWSFESTVNELVNAGATTRSSLLNEPVVTLDDKDPTRTDILHEYFISPNRFAEFVFACQDVIPSSFQELLNITLRFVDTDRDSMLTYATQPRIAAVMLFSQEKSARAEADMARMTRDLIDRVHAIGGTYYLPYRPHATRDQFHRAYPRHAEFAELKRKFDPALAFTNKLWDNYVAN